MKNEECHRGEPVAFFDFRGLSAISYFWASSTEKGHLANYFCISNRFKLLLCAGLQLVIWKNCGVWEVFRYISGKLLPRDNEAAAYERLDVSALPAGLYPLHVRQRGAPPEAIKFMKE